MASGNGTSRSSGNPAKAARQRTIAEVRAAVAEGKTATLRPWPDTVVTIKTTNPDYAESVVSFIEIMDPKSRDLNNVAAMTHLFSLFLNAYATDEKNIKPLRRWVEQAGRDLDND